MKLRLDASSSLSLSPVRIERDCSSHCPPWDRVCFRDRIDAVLRCFWQGLFRSSTSLGRTLVLDGVVVGVESRWLRCGYSLWMRMP